MTLHLYDYFRSSAGYRVRIALGLKGVAYTREDVMLVDNEQRSPDHLARNPQGLVPVLDTGVAMLSQSLAIIDWIEAKYPNPALLPAEPTARARVLAQVYAIACDIHPIDNLRVLRYLERDLGVEKAARDDWYRHWVVQGFDALEKTVGDGPFLGGDAPNLADVCLVPQMFNARRFDVPLDAYPGLVRADAAASELDAFARAHPDRVKGVASL
ncbi:maleylacetoacetate isomerase [Stakelama marina]|uniref:Maleylacetoacetate isomerase n=1 Tax=Stakelama marina TaxID=2826939 RepID=A0A8T4IEJ3_9SPHN|nr:maleylacetoacetate isomerase [Stakelama marina]MBR0552482.1 maleylacetoacetate isomerase [Stakelama marina]